MAVAIQTWSWESAPEHYKRISRHNGNEVWVVAIPQAMAEGWITPFESVLHNKADYLPDWGYADKHTISDYIILIFADRN